jgi:hypothetical protein
MIRVLRIIIHPATELRNFISGDSMSCSYCSVEIQKMFYLIFKKSRPHAEPIIFKIKFRLQSAEIVVHIKFN